MKSQTVVVPQVGDYHVDTSHSTISFTTRHIFGLAAVHGTFDLREGHIYVAENPADSSARAVIATSSIQTGNSTRDNAVRSAAYLDAERYPDITFVATKSAEVAGHQELRGSLKAHGQARPLNIQIESLHMTDHQLIIRATATVDRYAFGVTKMKGMAARYLKLQLDITANPS
jgi:polyisoprenoid-binding protein YceI